MVIRLALNTLVHAAAGLAVGGLAIAAAEGWRRARRTPGSAANMNTDMDADRPPASGRPPDAPGAPDG